MTSPPLSLMYKMQVILQHKYLSYGWTSRHLVDDLSVTNNGDKSFVNFHVSAANIKNGNAVIAVKSADGTIMWSWHLWFDHSDALSTIACTNHEGDNFKVTKNILGYTLYNGNQHPMNLHVLHV